jgi:hypothetical protein
LADLVDARCNQGNGGYEEDVMDSVHWFDLVVLKMNNGKAGRFLPITWKKEYRITNNE